MVPRTMSLCQRSVINIKPNGIVCGLLPQALCRTTAGSRRVQEATLKIDGGRSSSISGDGHASKAESPIQGEIKKSRLGRTLKRNRKADCILNSNTKIRGCKLHNFIGADGRNEAVTPQLEAM